MVSGTFDNVVEAWSAALSCTDMGAKQKTAFARWSAVLYALDAVEVRRGWEAENIDEDDALAKEARYAFNESVDGAVGYPHHTVLGGGAEGGVWPPSLQHKSYMHSEMPG